MTVIGKKKKRKSLPFPEEMKGNLDGFVALLKKIEGTRSADLALCSPVCKTMKRSERKAARKSQAYSLTQKPWRTLCPSSLLPLLWKLSSASPLDGDIYSEKYCLIGKIDLFFLN